MRRLGLSLGIGLSIAFSAAVTAVHLAWGSGPDQAVTAAWIGLAFLAITVPLGCFFGVQYDKLRGWAERDTLTGACTRRFLQTGYPRLVAQADRRRKRMSVLLVDVNDFKAVNDTLGHAKGDELLRKLACGLMNASRHGEIVGRWGGDEFLLLCPYGDRSALEALNRAISEQIAGISAQWNRPLSVSVGTAVYPDDGRVLDELVQAADRGMYADKHRRKEVVQQRLKA
ncbi:GGDEF domain-containing protein [Cohnella candidum]|uniref:GGDEF domain-containing protein n=1 Tax=Cohnella candidum TaxID=2674991 RepID=A0A3G3JSS1_9BACL|nr:GGDEF domain-containing protein [Cohnella candidum]AYQ71263.1 GGDEF domain-containing protein [Cohnella candidum]